MHVAGTTSDAVLGCSSGTVLEDKRNGDVSNLVLAHMPVTMLFRDSASFKAWTLVERDDRCEFLGLADGSFRIVKFKLGRYLVDICSFSAG